MHPHDRSDPDRHARRRFSLLVADQPQTVLRVASLCMRRGAIVCALRYEATDEQPGCARLDLEVSVDEPRGRGLDLRLAGLVEVRDLVELSSTHGTLDDQPEDDVSSEQAPAPRGDEIVSGTV